ncbi:MAG: AmmeMemoRadiSam system protein B [Treponema sp.]|nr:AmmeMemoRadiSam system protein B [Treponema sp.]MCL2251985.1 AmmeMemoRadiSam system protein B [Treponema sp.]
MQIREYSLPSGWYPRDSEAVSRFLSEFPQNKTQTGLEHCFSCAIAPHAGWYYSGQIAARAVSGLQSDAQTIAVLGGHLPGSYPMLFAMEDAVKTPLGNIPIDKELRSCLMQEFEDNTFDFQGISEDKNRDNTIEVLLPMVRYYFPKSELLWLRLPAHISSFKAGKVIFSAAAKLNRKINVLASTDLTHYGPNYGFSPKGRGKEALRWVREKNDAKIIKAVESGDSAETLRCANEDFSSCSAGAVLGAMGFSAAMQKSLRLLVYGTSAETSLNDNNEEVPDSFVGYAAFGQPGD